MSLPPHLPPPACKIETHHNLQRLKVLLVATFFGLLSGLTGASIILGWVWNGYGGGDTWVVAQQSRLAWSSHQLEERVQKEISARVVSVYSAQQSLNGVSYFSPEDKLGEAIVVSSDGWLAMYQPKNNINLKRARVLAMGGSVYELEKVLSDSHSGLMFLKISLAKDADRQRVGGQFQVVSLADTIAVNDDVFVYQRNGWRASVVNADTWDVWAKPHLDTAPAQSFVLSGNFPDGTIVINEQGRVAGLMMNENVFLPIGNLAKIMPTVLDKQKIVYASLGVEGWYDSEQPIIVKTEQVRNSFLVSKVTSKRSSLRVGDIITEINGQIVTPENLWYNISGNKTVRLKVWRNGKATEIVSETVSV